jgi:carbamoylphosphate synthase large subunit
MSELAIGRHFCDAFHLVPPGSEPGFADTLAEISAREGVDAILPQSSYDLLPLAEHKDRFGDAAVLVANPEAVRRSNDKAETYALLHRIGVRAPEFRRVNGAREVSASAARPGGGSKAPRRSRPPRASSATPARTSPSSRSSRQARAASASSRPRPTAAASCSRIGPASPTRSASRSCSSCSATTTPRCW